MTMTYTEKAIQLSIGGGWDSKDYHLHGHFGDIYLSPPIDRYINSNAIFLDPIFWSSLGNSLGWDKEYDYERRMESWKGYWHNFIDHLIAGKPAESFFESLINVKG